MPENGGAKERYYSIVIGDTIVFIKPTSIPHVIKELNNFHSNMQFTYEEERDGNNSIFRCITHKKNNTFETTVYRKPTDKGIYLH